MHIQKNQNYEQQYQILPCCCGDLISSRLEIHHLWKLMQNNVLNCDACAMYYNEIDNVKDIDHKCYSNRIEHDGREHHASLEYAKLMIWKSLSRLSAVGKDDCWNQFLSTLYAKEDKIMFV